MIGLGVVLIKKFAWLTYVFGVFLLYSAYKMWTTDEGVHPNKNPIIKWVKRFFPVTKSFEGEHFFVRRRHILAATPLFIALLVVSAVIGVRPIHQQANQTPTNNASTAMKYSSLIVVNR